MPAKQVATDCAPTGHALLHRPQLARLVVVSTQEGPHIIRPVPTHDDTQAEETHDSPIKHALPQRPQFALSAEVSMHPDPHIIRPPPEQVGVQLPDTQVAPSPQALPQRPQCSGSVFVLAQVPEQGTVPAVHAPILKTSVQSRGVPAGA